MRIEKLKHLKSAAKDILLLDNYEDYSLEDYIEILTLADEFYHNGNEESFLTDEQYDGLKQYAFQLDPTNSYFAGVGSEARGGKVKLPYPMGSLDQIYEGEIEQWVIWVIVVSNISHES